MGEFSSMKDTERLESAGAVLLDDAAQWLDETHPRWRKEAPDHNLFSAIQAVVNAWEAREGARGALAVSLASEVALLICAHEDRSLALQRFDELLDEALKNVDADRARAS